MFWRSKKRLEAELHTLRVERKLAERTVQYTLDVTLDSVLEKVILKTLGSFREVVVLQPLSESKHRWMVGIEAISAVAEATVEHIKVLPGITEIYVSGGGEFWDW